jgi:hypothetical protein
MTGGGIMLRVLISILTGVSLIFSTTFTEVASAASKAEKEAKQVEKIKQKVRKVGTDEYARITVGLKSQSKELKGYVSEIGEDGFVVMNSKTKVATAVAYRDVAYIRGKGLPPIAIVGITVGAVLGVLLIWALLTKPYD